jgi:hypothetical protein
MCVSVEARDGENGSAEHPIGHPNGETARKGDVSAWSINIASICTGLLILTAQNSECSPIPDTGEPLNRPWSRNPKSVLNCEPFEQIALTRSVHPATVSRSFSRDGLVWPMAGVFESGEVNTLTTPETFSAAMFISLKSAGK